MACPTCDHTMHSLSAADHTATLPMFWCPRCGTVRIGDTHSDTPKLVERCRTFAAEEFATYSPEKGHGVTSPPARWRSSGIAESINLPDERK